MRCAARQCLTSQARSRLALAVPCGAVGVGAWTSEELRSRLQALQALADPQRFVSEQLEARSARVACEAGTALPLISLDEVRKHCSEGDIWVTYNGEVYDVTELVSWHPGGKEALLGAGGLDLSAFWDKYTIHYKTAKATTKLEPCKIGRLSEADAERAQSSQDAETAGATRKHNILASVDEGAPPVSVARARARADGKTRRLVGILALAPVLNITRHFLSWLHCLCPPLARFVAARLPVGVHGVGPGARLDPKKDPEVKPSVAVVGGGIAGCGCAYALVQSGFDVTLYEPRELLGGNAQRHTFHHNGKAMTQDLTVLFWASEFYKNYTCLLERLKIEPAVIQATYSLRTNRWGQEEWFTPPGTEAEKVLKPSLVDRFPQDFERFQTMVSWVNRIDNFFTMDSSPSFYKHVGVFSYFNPLNYITLKKLCKLSGISDEWYNGFLVPFHGWNFSSIHIDDLPALAIGALDHLVPLDKIRNHESWGPGTSKEVFEKMTVGADVKLNTRIERVSETKSGLLVKDEYGQSRQFDRVVLACPAGAASNVLGGNWLERSLLDGVIYQDDYGRSDWKDWIENPVHTDTRVVPGTALQQERLMKDLSFIVDVDVEQQHAEYTHILGSWSPAAKAAGEHGAPMFVTQSVFPNRPVDESKVEWHTSAPRAHPQLCMHNLLTTQMLSMIQGRRGVYYCGNWTTGGNGHDLSFLAGLCVAGAIGADYPFSDNKRAQLDYRQKCEFMGLPAARNTTSLAEYWPVAAAGLGLGWLAGRSR